MMYVFEIRGAGFGVGVGEGELGGTVDMTIEGIHLRERKSSCGSIVTVLCGCERLVCS
jgi:hypothetical protein